MYVFIIYYIFIYIKSYITNRKNNNLKAIEYLYYIYIYIYIYPRNV